MSVEEDIIIAEKKIRRKSDIPILFTNASHIYKTTNENMSNPNYKSQMKDREKQLSVIGSGDQIINSILLGAKEIDAFDISRFPKYFLDLKLAAIKLLSYEEYVEFFFGKNVFDKKNYNRIVDSLEGDSKIFWSLIANTRMFSKTPQPKEVYNSSLFTGEIIPQRVIRLNPYLEKESYNRLKHLIDEVRIHYITGNILHLGEKIKKDYDFVNLSNICMYQSESVLDTPYVKKDCKFKSFIKNLRLNRDGRVLNYLMGFKPRSVTYRYYENYYQSDPDFRIYEIDNSKEQIINDALLVYQKTK